MSIFQPGDAGWKLLQDSVLKPTLLHLWVLVHVHVLQTPVAAAGILAARANWRSGAWPPPCRCLSGEATPKLCSSAFSGAVLLLETQTNASHHLSSSPLHQGYQGVHHHHNHVLCFCLQRKYPSAVSLPGGGRSEVMTLSHPELPG